MASMSASTEKTNTTELTQSTLIDASANRLEREDFVVSFLVNSLNRVINRLYNAGAPSDVMMILIEHMGSIRKSFPPGSLSSKVFAEDAASRLADVFEKTVSSYLKIVNAVGKTRSELKDLDASLVRLTDLMVKPSEFVTPDIDRDLLTIFKSLNDRLKTSSVMTDTSSVGATTQLSFSDQSAAMVASIKTYCLEHKDHSLGAWIRARTSNGWDVSKLTESDRFSLLNWAECRSARTASMEDIRSMSYWLTVWLGCRATILSATHLDHFKRYYGVHKDKKQIPWKDFQEQMIWIDQEMTKEDLLELSKWCATYDAFSYPPILNLSSYLDYALSFPKAGLSKLERDAADGLYVAMTNLVDDKIDPLREVYVKKLADASINKTKVE
jgi:hypothetical protein